MGSLCWVLLEGRSLYFSPVLGSYPAFLHLPLPPACTPHYCLPASAYLPVYLHLYLPASLLPSAVSPTIGVSIYTCCHLSTPAVLLLHLLHYTTFHYHTCTPHHLPHHTLPCTVPLPACLHPACHHGHGGSLQACTTCLRLQLHRTAPFPAFCRRIFAGLLLGRNSFYLFVQVNVSSCSVLTSELTIHLFSGCTPLSSDADGFHRGFSTDVFVSGFFSGFSMPVFVSC